MTEPRQRPPRRRSPKPHTELYALRLNAGLSRADLAYRASLSIETIRLAELGFTPGPRVQFALAKVFGLQPLDLWPLERQRALAA